MKYKVTLVSKDGQTLEYVCQAEDSREAIANAHTHIADNGWTQYEYKIVTFEKVK